MKNSRLVASPLFAALFVSLICVSTSMLGQQGPPPSGPPPQAQPQGQPQGPGPGPGPGQGPGQAQEQGQGQGDVPGRAVDLHYVSGQVSVQPAGMNDWVEGAVNRPLTTADKVWADKNSRAELHLGTSVIRIDSETSLTLTNVNDQTVQVELDQGALNLRVRKIYDGEVYEVDTLNLA